MSSGRVARGPAIGRLIRPYTDVSLNEQQTGQCGAHINVHDQDEQDMNERSDGEPSGHSDDELAYDDGTLIHAVPLSLIHRLTRLCEGFDTLDAHQYIHEVEDGLEEHTFNLDEIRHAIDYNDLVDELG